jgi:hypothetical protein
MLISAMPGALVGPWPAPLMALTRGACCVRRAQRHHAATRHFQERLRGLPSSVEAWAAAKLHGGTHLHSAGGADGAARSPSSRQQGTGAAPPAANAVAAPTAGAAVTAQALPGTHAALADTTAEAAGKPDGMVAGGAAWQAPAGGGASAEQGKASGVSPDAPGRSDELRLFVGSSFGEQGTPCLREPDAERREAEATPPAVPQLWGIPAAEQAPAHLTSGGFAAGLGASSTAGGRSAAAEPSRGVRAPRASASPAGTLSGGAAPQGLSPVSSDAASWHAPCASRPPAADAEGSKPLPAQCWWRHAWTR